MMTTKQLIEGLHTFGQFTLHETRMTVYCGWTRETAVERDVVDCGAGAGAIDCLECNGSGWWAFMEPEIPGQPCVDCKGTGRVLVSIA